MRTEVQDGIPYRVVEFEGRIPSGEGIEFLSAEKAWGGGHGANTYMRIFYALDGVRQSYALGLDLGHEAFGRDGLWGFMDQPARLAFFESSVKPIMDFLREEGMFEGEMEGLL